MYREAGLIVGIEADGALGVDSILAVSLEMERGFDGALPAGWLVGFISK
jgi:hypothetical protein